MWLRLVMRFRPMPRFFPNALLSDCWSSAGNVTFYHRNGVCYFRSKAFSEFVGTAEQLEQKGLHHRAILAWQTLTPRQQQKWRRLAVGVAAHRPPFGDGNHISGYNLSCRPITDSHSWAMSTFLSRNRSCRSRYSVWIM